LTTREFVTLIWISVLIVLAVAIPAWRRVVWPALGPVLKALAQWKIIVLLLAYFAWCALVVWIGCLVGAWTPSLVKDTVIIALTAGLPTMFRLSDAKSGPLILRRVLFETVGLTAILLFLLNLESFPFWIELFFQPITAFLAMMAAVAAINPEHAAVRRLSNVLLGLSALAAVTWAIVRLLQEWSTLDLIETGRSFALTIWLPFLTLPFFYGVAFLTAASGILFRLGWSHSRKKSPPVHVTLAVLIGLRFRLSLASRMLGEYNQIGDSPTFGSALRAMRDFRSDIRQKNESERERLDALRRNTGQAGTDDQGAQLDRREFDGTKRQLERLSVSQMGHYNGQNYYWKDQAHLWVEPQKFGLPTEPPFVVETTSDGQRWRGWRRTPSGWVLGIGGKGSHSEWLYSAAEPPHAWPGDAGSPWIDTLKEPDLPPDWEKDDGTRL